MSQYSSKHYKLISAVCGSICGGIMTNLYNRNGGTVQLCPNILQNISMHTSIVSCTWSTAEYYTIFGHNSIHILTFISLYWLYPPYYIIIIILHLIIYILFLFLEEGIIHSNI